MATIHRHPVPPESYEPDRPLNDLGRDQLKHFIHVAQRLPPELRVDLPIPSPEDGLASSRFIGAVTEKLMSRKRAPLRLVSKRSRKVAEKSATDGKQRVIPRIAASAPSGKGKDASSGPRTPSARK